MAKALLACFAACALLSATGWAGPVEFGMQEFRDAAREAGVNVSVETELSQDPPRTFRIQVFNSGNGRVSGGDLRGLMYGLLEAAEQIRTDGKLSATRGQAATSVRGVRMQPSPAAMGDFDFFSRLVWRANFRILARSRINQFTLVMPLDKARVADLKMVSEMANEHGVDFVLGLESLDNPDRLYASLREILDECVYIRGVQVDASAGPARVIPNVVMRALSETGRRVALDLHGIENRPELAQAALDAGIPLRVSSLQQQNTPAADVHTIMHDAESVEDEGAIRKRIESLKAAGLDGFEIDTLEFDLAEHEEFFRAWGWLGFSPDAEVRPVAPLP